MIGFRTARETDAAAWHALLGRCEAGDFLHDWAWGEVARYDGEPQVRYVAESGSELRGICLAQVRRTLLGRSIWYVPHGPVLDYAAADADDVVEAVLRGIRDAARAARAVLVILEPRLESGSADAALFDAAGVETRAAGSLQVGQTRIVDIGGDDDALMAGFDKDTRYAIRRSEREGVTVSAVTDATDLPAADALHELMAQTQRRAGFPLPARERVRTAWRALGAAGRAVILEARHQGRLVASGMLVIEGHRSFYLFAGSVREGQGESKRFATYALQWAMMRTARDRGSRSHDLWGIAPLTAGADHPWHGVGLFKRGFGGRVVEWMGAREMVIDPWLDRARRAAGTVRGVVARTRRGNRGA